VDWVCLAHDRNSEQGAAISHSAKEEFSVLDFFLCISESVGCNAVNLYKADIISFYAT
jgi:hypothetical protein